MCRCLIRNLAAAERTLQKSLGTVREAGADPVRPHFRSRLAGTLADIIARAEQTAAMAPGKNKKDNAVGRRAEIVDLLSYAFEVRAEKSSSCRLLHGPESLVARNISNILLSMASFSNLLGHKIPALVGKGGKGALDISDVKP